MSFHSVSTLNPLDVLEQFSGSTLVLPIVSIGNIPQLTTDLLIYNLPDVQLVGRLDGTWVYPLAGPADFVDGTNPQDSLATPLEIYYCAQYNLTVLQQRSPILPGCTQRFFTELIKPFIELCEFERLVVLQSRDQGLREDRYATKRLLLWTDDLAKSLDVSLSLNDHSSIASVSTCGEVSPVAEFLLGQLAADKEDAALRPSAMERSTSNLFCLINSAKTMELSTLKRPDSADDKTQHCAVLSLFAYEDDNTEDAETLYAQVLNLLRIGSTPEKKSSPLITPKSWTGVYGNKAIPPGIEYGLYT